MEIFSKKPQFFQKKYGNFFEKTSIFFQKIRIFSEKFQFFPEKSQFFQYFFQYEYFQVSLSSRISSKKAVLLRETQLDTVMRLRCENQARLTDCISLQFRQFSTEFGTLNDMYTRCSELFPYA